MTGTILIVDDLATNRIILRARLGSACYNTLAATNGAEALEVARKHRPDLILLDIMMPDMDGIAVCRALRDDPRTAGIPVVLVTASNEQALRLAALDAGARDFLTKPLDEMVLLARVRSLLRASELESELQRQCALCDHHGLADAAPGFEVPPRVALVGASARFAAFWRRQVMPLYPGCRVETLSVAEALGLQGAGHDVYVIAPEIADEPGGLRLLLDLRTRKPTRRAALCVALATGATESCATALDLGADDLLAGPFDPAEAALRLQLLVARKRRVDALRNSVDEGLNLAAIDPLTGLLNRRAAGQRLRGMAAQCRREGSRFAVMLLDLDRFKAINDSFGHGVGDKVLQAVAGRLEGALGPADVLARHGGEEFLVALAGVTAGRAREVGEHLCRLVEATRINAPGLPVPLQVTMSVGLALSDAAPDGESAAVERVIERADRALLASKAHGRNQVTVNQTAA